MQTDSMSTEGAGGEGEAIYIYIYTKNLNSRVTAPEFKLRMSKNQFNRVGERERVCCYSSVFQGAVCVTDR